MARTINGKSVAKVMEELAAPFDDQRFKVNYFGHAYLPVEVFRDRLDVVVGNINYDVTTSEPQVVVVGTRPQVLLKVSITIRDDDGNVVVTKESPGGTAVIVSNTTGEPDSVKNDAESAASDGFKRCCKLLGMAGKQLKQKRGSSGENSGMTAEVTTEPTALYRITLQEKFTKLGKDGYSAMVKVEGGGDTKLIIWKDAQDKISEKIPFDKFLQCYVPGKSFSLYGQKGTFTGKNNVTTEQIVMVAPYCNGGE